MNKELKSKWIAALRGGELKQGQGYLLDGDGYCCLGVLAHVCGVPDDVLFNKEILDDIKREDILGAWRTETAPRGSFYKNDPSTWETTQQKLAGLNDTGKTFTEIADWIETNIPDEQPVSEPDAQ